MKKVGGRLLALTAVIVASVMFFFPRIRRFITNCRGGSVRCCRIRALPWVSICKVAFTWCSKSKRTAPSRSPWTAPW